MSRLARVEILRAAGGLPEQHEVGRHILTEWIRRMIGADTLDTVNLRDGRIMTVDDLGHQKALPRNARATMMYHDVCVPGTMHEIRGDVAISWDEDYA